MRYKCHVNDSPIVCWQMNWWEGDSVTGYEVDGRVAEPLCSCGCQQWYNGINIVQPTIISGLCEWHEWWDMLRSQKVWIKAGERWTCRGTVLLFRNTSIGWKSSRLTETSWNWTQTNGNFCIRWKNSMEYNRLGADRLENSFIGKGLRP